MKVPSKTMLTIIGGFILINIFLQPITVLAWGDSEGGRDEYTIEEINKLYENGEWPEDKIVFNSISDSVIGHEFNYVGAREGILRADGRCEGVPGKNVWNGNDIDVEDGKIYLIRLYVHNNNPYGIDNNEAGVAEDVRVAFSIPSTSSTQVQVNGFISSSNATPDKYVDYVNFNSEVPFHLEYIDGSALLENNGIGKGGLSLPDEVVNTVDGTLIGYDKLDGRIPGCFQYDNFVSIQVKAVFDYDFTVENEVRLADSEDKTWYKAVEAKVGDRIEIQIGYYNTSNESQKNVAIKDILPNNLKYIEGSTMLKNSNYPDGVSIVEDSLVDNGIKIGSYAPAANAYVMFTAEVVNNDLVCGANALNNWVHVGVGYTTIEDSATVHIVLGNKNSYVAILIILLLLCSVIFTTFLRKRQS